MSLFGRIAGAMPRPDTLWATAARVNTVLAALAFVFVYTGQAGKPAAGTLFLWLGVVNLAAAVGGLGRSQYVYAEPAAAFRRGDSTSMASFVLGSMLWIAAATALLTLLGVKLGAQELQLAPWHLILVLAVETAILNLLAEVLRVLRSFVMAALLNTGTSFLLLCIWAQVADRSWIAPEIMLLGLLSAHGMLVIAGAWACWQRLWGPAEASKPLRALRSIGWPLPRQQWAYWLNNVPVVALYQVDVVVVGIYFGPENLAGYTMASRLAGGLSFINSLAYVILPARVSDLLVQGRMNDIGTELRRFARGLSAMSVCATLLLAFGIMQGWPSLGDGAPVAGFFLLAAAHVVNSFLGARSVVLQLAGHARLQASISWTFALLCSVLLSVAAVSGTLVFVFVAVAVSIAGQAMVEAWLLRRRLGISSIPGVRDARPSAELMTGRRRQ